MLTDPYIDAFWLKSRVMRALFYDRRSRKMIVQTTHGKFLIYRDIDQQLTQELAAHSAPGMLYEQTLRAALKPKLAKMTLANFLLLRRVRKIAKAGSQAAASEAAPDDHADRRPDTGR